MASRCYGPALLNEDVDEDEDEDRMRTHEQFREDLALYALNELTGTDREEFDQHVESCPSCRREVEALRSDLGLLALSTTGPRPPARSKDRLMRAVALEPRRPGTSVSETTRRRGLGWGLIPAVVALALLFAVGNLWRENGELHEQMGRLTGLYRNTSAQLAQSEEQIAAVCRRLTRCRSR